MSNINDIIGERIRNRRNKMDLSQEELAEKCGLHSTYIGQLERGEKNPTVDSLVKVTSGLEITLESLFEKIGQAKDSENLSLAAYKIFDALEEEEQKAMIDLLKRIVDYKKI